MKQKIGIASDHGGKQLKQKVLEFLASAGFEVVDYGVAIDSPSVDYPDYAEKLAKDLSQKRITKGIAICGTGIGMCIAANKVPGVRAASVWDEFTARVSRQHNDANIICLGERVLNFDRALDFIKIWLETPFEGDRHKRRVDKISAIEAKNMKDN
jgi:ribose 5-phosphate isomerase B